MKEQLLALAKLQELDIQIGQAQAKLAALDGARDLKKKYIAARSAKEAVEKTLKDVETELMDIELQLKSVDEKRVKFEKRLYGGSITNPKELSATEKEVSVLKDQQGKLDTKALELYDSVESQRSQAEQAQTAFKAVEKDLRKALASQASQKEALDGELADLAPKREAAAVEVTDKALMSRYDAVRKRTGSTGLARIISNRCEGCHINVQTFNSAKLREGKEIVTCENCGRILMLDSTK